MTTPNPRRREDVTFEKLPDGSAVLYDKRTNTAHPLTTSAAEIWQACDGTRSVAEIVERLAATYAASQETIERDVEAFLRQLAEKQLLEDEGAA